MIQKTGKIKSGKVLKSIFFPAVTVILSLFLIGFLFLSGWRMYQRSADLTFQIRDLEKEIQDLERKNQELNEGFSQLSDADYLEKTAREKLGFKKPGEEVVVVLPPPEAEKEPQKPKGFWQKLLERLGF